MISGPGSFDSTHPNKCQTLANPCRICAKHCSVATPALRQGLWSFGPQQIAARVCTACPMMALPLLPPPIRPAASMASASMPPEGRRRLPTRLQSLLIKPLFRKGLHNRPPTATLTPPPPPVPRFRTARGPACPSRDPGCLRSWCSGGYAGLACPSATSAPRLRWRVATTAAQAPLHEGAPPHLF